MCKGLRKKWKNAESNLYAYLFTCSASPENVKRHNVKTSGANPKNGKKKRTHATPSPAQRNRSMLPLLLIGCFCTGGGLSITFFFLSLQTLQSPDLLIGAVSQFSAGAPGAVYVRLSRDNSASGTSVFAALAAREGTLHATGQLNRHNTAMLSFDLHGISAGPAELTIQTEDFSLKRTIRIQSSNEIQLWSGFTASDRQVRFHSLIALSPQIPAAPSPQAEVVFQLHDPSGKLVARRQVLTDRRGVAEFVRSFHRPVPAGSYFIDATVQGETVSAAIPLSDPHNKDRPRSSTPPAAGSGTEPNRPAPAARPAFSVAVAGKNLKQGEAVQFTITSKSAADRVFAAELLQGRVILKSCCLAASPGTNRFSMDPPPHMRGRTFLRIWPVDQNPDRETVTTSFLIPHDPEAVFSASLLPEKTLSITNHNKTHELFASVLSSDAPPVFTSNGAEPGRAAVFQCAGATRSPHSQLTEAFLFFWAGLSIFFISLPLLYCFGALLIPLHKQGLTIFFGIAFLLYLLISLHCKLLGIALIAFTLFLVYAVFRAAFQELPKRYKHCLRFVVPLLCIVPYIFAHVTQQGKENASPAGPRFEGDAIGKKASHSSRPDMTGFRPIPAGDNLHTDIPGQGRFVLVLGKNNRGEGDAVTLLRKNKTPLSVQLKLPASLTAHDREHTGDTIEAPLKVINRGAMPWKGSLSITADPLLACRWRDKQSTITIPPDGGQWETRLHITAEKPGKGTLTIAFDDGQKQVVSLAVSPYGIRRRSVWNGTLQNSTDENRFFNMSCRPVLPQNAIYSTPQLTARLFPGPLSRFLAIMNGEAGLPAPQLEAAVTRAHAACLGLLYLESCNCWSPEAPLLRDELSSALLKLYTFQSRNGAFLSPKQPDDPVCPTVSVLLLFQDLTELWPTVFTSRHKAEEFLLSLVRIDGTFRAGDLDRAVSNEELLNTCLAAFALGEKTPMSTRRFLAERFATEKGQDLLAPLLAACKQSCALPPPAIAEATEKIAALPLPALHHQPYVCAFWTYGLCASGVAPELSQKALALLSLQKNHAGRLSTVVATQLLLRSIFLCAPTERLDTVDIFQFEINQVVRHKEKQKIGPETPDIPVDVDLTDYLHFGEQENSVTVFYRGRFFTPYQVLFSYAEPYAREQVPSSLLELSTVFSRTTVPLNGTTECTLLLTNRSKKELPAARLLIHIPALLELSEAPPKTDAAVLAGDGKAGEALLLSTIALKPSETLIIKTGFKAVMKGQVYVQPAAAFLPEENEEKAYAMPEFLIVTDEEEQ